MAKLLCKTLGDVSPRGKARVYFACHPEDYKRFFGRITNELLEHSNCAVYYYEEEPELNEEYYANLNQMQLMVIPVTTRLLCLPNRAMDVEFAYAQANHIPVLPLMQEQSLAEAYEKKFGNLQFLDKENRDLTAIPYGEKLKSYLDAVLLNDELTAQIRAAFDTWIFLSYRKKDRKAAQELMRLIHSDPRCRDIAIWYDEFLNPGEDFNDAILKALQESDLFVLAVTPNMVEENNYVMTEEYPKARAAEKPILPAEMERTNRNALQKGFPGMPELLDPCADGAVSGAVLDALRALAVRENDEDPKHNFFIGLAYLSGLFVEKDHPRAVNLITQAAESGLTEAMEKLVSMYESGEGVERDYRVAIQWRERLVAQVRRALEQGNKVYFATYQNDLTYRLISLGKAYFAVNDMPAAIKTVKEAIAITKLRLEKNGREDIWRDLSLCYEMLGRIYLAEGSYSAAKEQLSEALGIVKHLAEMTLSQNRAELEIYETHRQLANCYDAIGEISFRTNELSAARDFFLCGLKARLKLETFKQNDIQREIADSYWWLGNVCGAEEDFRAAKAYFDKSMAINDRLAAVGDIQAKWNRFEVCDCQGMICLNEEDLAGAERWYREALTIAETELDDTLDANRNICRCSYMLGGIREQLGDHSQARSWYTKALAIAEKSAQTNAVDSCNELARVCMLLGQLENDVTLIRRAGDIWAGLFERCPEMPRYRELTLFAENEIVNIQNNS